MISRLSRMFSSTKKKPLTTTSTISPVGMEMSSYFGNEDGEAESDAETVEDEDALADMETKSEMFTSPPLTPRTPMMIASPPPPRKIQALFQEINKKYKLSI